MTDEERQQRIHHHMYTTCEGIAEHAERIVKLEELVQDMRLYLGRSLTMPYIERVSALDDIEDRMDELGILRGQ